MWNLNENARAVAGLRIAAAGSAMGEINQDLNALADDFVRLLPVEIDHETHAAGVVLMTGVIEPLATWRVFHDLPYPIHYYHVNWIYPIAILDELMV